MSDHACGAVRNWLTHQQQERFAPPVRLSAHVAQCSLCQGLVAASMAAALNIAKPSTAFTCASCEDSLDVCIDHHRRHGAASALRRYPDVWWHLWVCPDCAELYHYTCTLIDALETGELTTMPVTTINSVSQLPRCWPALQLPRSYLHQVFAPRATLGTAWSGAAEEVVLAEDKRAHCHITVFVEHHGATSWHIGVEVIPWIVGVAVLAIGDLQTRSPFNAVGKALFTDVPLVLLTAETGPDLLITIEHHDTDA